MSNTNRPLSPHLQVYKPQITSVLSILHRATGAALAVGALALTYWLFTAASSEQCFTKLQEYRSHIIGQVMLSGWLFSFIYHMLNGIRHLKWDCGYGINMKSVYASGWVLIIGSIVLTVLLWMSV